MSKYTKSMERFLAKHTHPLTRSLAEKLIEQMGGEEYVVNNHKKINQFGAHSGFKGISSASDLLAFFDLNRVELLDFAQVRGNSLCIGAPEFLSMVMSDKDFSKYDARSGLDEAPSENIEDTGVERMRVAHWAVWAAVENLTDAYNKYITDETSDDEAV